MRILSLIAASLFLLGGIALAHLLAELVESAQAAALAFPAGGWPAFAAELMAAVAVPREPGADPRLHIRNFLDCIKSRNRPNCDVESAHRSTTTANIATIAYRTRQLLEWDAEREEFTNNRAANAMLHYEYRSPWKL